MTSTVSINHQVGSKTINLGICRDIASAPFRYYYQTRNYLWLLRRSYVPKRWKITTGIKCFLRLFYVPFFVPQGWKAMHFIMKGIRAGFTY